MWSKAFAGFGLSPEWYKAAVMPLKAWLPDGVLQALAAENNLSETAFFVPEPEASKTDFHIRWFTPEIEVSLCGHATLASAWVIFNKLGWASDRIRLHSKSGPLGVHKQSDMQKIKQLKSLGLIVTAPGTDSDFVSRYFVPCAGINEDPVTGSIHSALVPYWAEKLGKKVLEARQLSARGGLLHCELKGERVAIAGQAAFYMEGTVYLQ